MEKRIGTVLIQVLDHAGVQQMNGVISKHGAIVIGRQGLPRQDGTSIISLLLEGTTDEIGSLSGQLGRLPGIEVKSVVLKKQGDENKN